jgi:hypothetical protein
MNGLWTDSLFVLPVGYNMRACFRCRLSTCLRLIRFRIRSITIDCAAGATGFVAARPEMRV